MMREPAAVADPVLLAYTGMAALVLSAAWQWGGAEWLLRLAAPLWLAPLAVYDLRQRQVPHIAWVAGPCLLVMALTAVRGDWALAALALVAVAASERPRLPAIWRRPALGAAVVTASWLAAMVPGPALPGGLALLAFWLMFELGWWAGADALAAIALTLIWPTITLLIALAAGHIAWAVVRRCPWRWPRRLTASELAATGQPGLPALALAAGLHSAIRFLV